MTGSLQRIYGRQIQGIRPVGRHAEAGARREAEAVERRAVLQAGALELLAEEAAAVAAQPLLERCMVKLVAVGDVGQTQHLLGCKAVIDQIVQEEILEVIRADGVLALLGDLAIARRGSSSGLTGVSSTSSSALDSTSSSVVSAT